MVKRVPHSKPKPGLGDGRSLPRKDDSEKRATRLAIGVTPAELEAIKQSAAERGLTMADYIVRRCLGASARPKPRTRRSDA